MSRVRVTLPAHLRNIAQLSGELELDVQPPITIGTILDALEARFPKLAGTIRDHGTGQRRPLVRFYVCQDDWSHESFDKPLPDAIAAGQDTFIILGAIAGG